MLTVNQTGMQTRITHTHIRQLTQQHLTELIAEYGGGTVDIQTDTGNEHR